MGQIVNMHDLVGEKVCLSPPILNHEPSSK